MSGAQGSRFEPAVPTSTRRADCTSDATERVGRYQSAVHGYRRLHILLLREGWEINAKRVYWLYGEENLGLRTRTPKRRVRCRTRIDRPEREQINDCWGMDFLADELFDGRRLRL